MIATKTRYQGTQTMLKQLGNTGCLLLCLLSIAEEVINDNIDTISACKKLLADGCVDDEFFCKDQERALFLLTGKKWKKEIRRELPSSVPINMYTVERWYNERTGYTHFKRRGYDTLVSSVTVKEGMLTSYYIYLLED